MPESINVLFIFAQISYYLHFISKLLFFRIETGGFFSINKTLNFG